VDNTTWSFENWASGCPRGYEYLMIYGGQWMDYKSSGKTFFLCQGPKVALTENGLASVEFNKEQLAFFSFPCDIQEPQT